MAKYLNEKETAEMLGMSVGKLSVWRSMSPKYTGIGEHVLYKLEDVEEFIKNN